MEQTAIARHVFHVSKKEFITPHYIRVTLQGDGATDFAACTIGSNNKIFIPPAGSKEVAFPVFDAEKGAWVNPADNEKPIVRTYTHRGIDVANKEILIDFVNHGDNGPASSWALHAQEGDALGVAMKLRKSPLYPAADWYFLIGDATAIPVLASILESLPPEAKGHCILEVSSPTDIQPQLGHAGFTIQWIFNGHPESGSSLAEEVLKVSIPDEGSRFAYVACEYSSVKALRTYFREELNWSNQELYAFSYWKAGVAEDQSAQDRRQEKEK